MGFKYELSKIWKSIEAVHPSSPSLSLFVSLILVKIGKNGKPHVLTLQDMEQDSLQFDLAAGSVEELYEWYKVAWDITQRAMSKQYNREQEVCILWHITIYVVVVEHTSNLD